MNSANRSNWSLGGSVVLSLGTLLLLLPFARIQFDTHHDGYMLATLLGFDSGLPLHSGVVNQYGPITTLIQRLFLELPSGPALSIRLSTTVMISGIVLFISDLGRVCPQSWGIAPRHSLTAAALWVILADAWRGVAMLPWSSVSASLLVAAGVWCLAVGTNWQKFEGQRLLASWFPLFTGGFLLGLVPFARINVGLALVAALVLIGLTIRPSDSRARTATLVVLSGFAGGSTAMAIYLVSTNSLKAYLQQAIFGPRQFASSMAGRDGWNSAEWLISVGLLRMLPASLFVGSLLLMWRIRRRELSAFRLVSILLLLFSFIFISRISWPGTSFISSLERGIFLNTQPAWEDFRLLQFFTFASIFAALGKCLLLISQRKLATSSNPIGTGVFLVPVCGLACLVQIYPAWDSRHLWWSLPIALISLTQVAEALARRSTAPLVITGLALLVTVPAALATGTSTIEKNSTSFQDIDLLDGMRGTDDSVQKIEGIRFFSNTRIGDRSAVFLASDGYLSIATGAYRSLDQFFISWDTSVPAFVYRVTERPDVVSDHDREKLTALISGSDYFLASRTENLTHLLAPPCIAGNCPGIEPNDVCMSWGSCRPRSAPEPLELVPDSSFSPVTPWSDWNVKVNTGFSYPEDDGAWITGHHARLTFDNVPTDTVRVSLYPFLPPEWTHIDINILTDSEATPIRLNDGVTTVDLPIKANTWNELVFRCDTLHRPSELGLGADERLLCAKVVGFEPIP